jgi:hypothetical protein
MRKDPRKDPLGHVQRQVISGALIIATDKNLPFLTPERMKLLPSGLSSQQPLELAQVVIESPMERPEYLVRTV